MNSNELTGHRLGPYQIVHEMGHGGMGIVYAAVRADDEYRKRVAIKVVRPGLDSEEILRRFRNERQTLAALDHPNIVKLLDGGSTEQGLPYLVMEYIEGVPIDRYCDGHKLSTHERLRLFRTVCGAVQYAHQNLVVHRDLKPTNILVTADGTPKLLDFGIAKLLNPESGGQSLQLTLPHLRAMTPEYASPEQVRGEPITTASDVYSLGVVLYELLTGHLPYDLERRSPVEVEQIICELEPEKPSAAVTRVEAIRSSDDTPEPILLPQPVSRAREAHSERLRRRLRGDIDNVVLKALRKEPPRRYGSAEQFSEDIRRHLEGLPVIARTSTLAYRGSKFIRRHKVGVAAAAAVAATLLAGIVVTTREARVAERRFQDVHHLANTLLFELDDAVKDLPGATPARKLIVQKALEYLDGLAKEAAGDPALQGDVAEAYLKVGEVQRSAYGASLGDAAGALESYRKASAVARSLARIRPSSPSARWYLARTEQSIGGVLVVTGHAAEAADSLRRAIPVFEALTAAQPSDTAAAIRLADSYNALGDALGSRSMVSNLRDVNGALENYGKAFTVYERLSEAYPHDPRIQSGLAVAYAKLGDIAADRGDRTGAMENYRKATTIYEALSAAEPNNAQYRRNLGSVIDRDGRARGAVGDTAGALRDFRRKLELDKASAAADPKNVAAQEALWLGYIRLGDWLQHSDRRGTLQNYRLGLAVVESLSAAQPSNFQVRSELGSTLIGLGDWLDKGGNKSEGRALISRGVLVQKSLADRPGASAFEVNEYATTLMDCDPDYPCAAKSAVPYAKRAVELTQARDPETLETLASAYFHIGDAVRAVETEQQALALVTTPAARAPYEANLAKFQKAAKRHSTRRP